MAENGDTHQRACVPLCYVTFVNFVPCDKVSEFQKVATVMIPDMVPRQRDEWGSYLLAWCNKSNHTYQYV